MQVNGENYLIPVDAKIENANSFKFHCVNVNEIVGNIHAKVNIIILDSCRDNPFAKTRGAGQRGLAAVTASSKNSIILA